MFSPAPRSLTDYAAQVEAIAEQLASMVKAAGKVVMLSRFVVLPRLANPESFTISGFDGAISDFEPAWTPEHGAGCESAATVGVGCDCCRADGRLLLRTDLRWLKIMATTFHSHGLQFSANCGADFDGGTQYAGFGLTGVDTYAMMDPTCKRRIPGSIALAVRLLHNVCCTTARVLHNV